jgi:polygalacturonase
VVVPADIDASGATDVTERLQSFIDSVPDGSTISFPAHSTYRVDGTLMLLRRHGLTIEGNGALFFSDDPTPALYAQRDRNGNLVTNPWRNRYHWSIHGGGGITLRNLNIRGANAQGGTGSEAYQAALEAQHGVNIGAATGVLLENLDISYVHGDFVYVGAARAEDGKTQVISRDITIRGGTWSHNGRQGIAITNADTVLVEGISMSETRRASIDLEPNSTRAIIRNITIRGSTFGPGRLLWLAAGGAAGTIENITLAHNQLVGRTMSVRIKTPEGSRRHNFHLVGNHSDRAGGGGNDTHGMWTVWRVDGFLAEGNLAPLNPWRQQVGAVFYESCDVHVPEGQHPGASPEVRITDYDCA